MQIPTQANGTEKINFVQNELLEAQDEQRLEPRTQSQTNSSDSPLETMAKVHGTKISNRKAKSLVYKGGGWAKMQAELLLLKKAMREQEELIDELKE